MKTRSPRILIIDDDLSNIRLLASIFDSYDNEKYDIFFTANGKEGVDIAVREQPDLILLDIIMPQISGYDICKQLQLNALTSSIPIVFITAISDMESEVYGLNWVHLIL